MAGCFNIETSGNFNINGFIYERTFDSLFLYMNLYSHSNNDGKKEPFKRTIYLEANVTYLLMETIVSADVSGLFSITTNGSSKVNFRGIGKSIYLCLVHWPSSI